MYITASSTISHQPTFRNKGFSLELSELKPGSQLITPDYSSFIPAMDRRRMSQVLKMAIACSRECLEQAGLSEPDAIIVGTSMGCCVHTRNFLDKIISANEGPLSPTSFIVSTHNTIAGQIALLLKNHGYNMTHTQNSLSFEQSLIDAMLCIKSGHQHTLVGAADEMEEALYNMKERLQDENIHLVCGASFFILSSKKNNTYSVKLADVESFGLTDDPTSVINKFLASNNLSAAQIDLVLYATIDQRKTAELNIIFGPGKIFDYQKITGTYFTNSAFAMNYGIDILSHKKHPVFGEAISKILVCNNLIPENLGLILLDNKSE
ncbi:MAG: beta-ketoacyl synthase chain length factor [Ferruginibacter sp.]